MNPDKIAIIIAVSFLVLLGTHYLALRAGWAMGTKTNPDVLMSKPTKDKSTPYEDKPDIYDEERLDCR